MFGAKLVAVIALQAFLMSGQVEAGALRRSGGDGHTARMAHVIRGLLDTGTDFSKRQLGGTCPSGYLECPGTDGCCPIGQTCDTLPDGTPVCCCSSGSNNCPKGYLPCSGNEDLCCPQGDSCTSDGGCVPVGSSGGGGGVGGGGTTAKGGSTTTKGAGSGGSKGASPSGTGGIGGTGGFGGTTDNFPTATGGIGGGGGLGGDTTTSTTPSTVGSAAPNTPGLAGTTTATTPRVITAPPSNPTTTSPAAGGGLTAGNGALKTASYASPFAVAMAVLMAFNF